MQMVSGRRPNRFQRSRLEPSGCPGTRGHPPLQMRDTIPSGRSLGVCDISARRHLPETMKAMRFLILIFATIGATRAAPPPNLERGKDLVEVPAGRDGFCLGNIYQSNMVLQREKPVTIWGWATAPGDEVVVSFGGQKQTAKASADHRTWEVKFAPMPANATPQTLTASSKDKTITLENILVGDIWVLGGQSNMEFEISKVDNGDLEVASANFPNIRLMSMPQMNGPEPRADFPRQYQWSSWFSTHFRQGYWDVCSPESVREMSAIGYVFARRIHMATQVPIGIIDASRGGTTLETWTPIEVLRGMDTPEVKAKLAEWDEKVAAFDPQKDLEARIAAYEKRVADKKAKGEPIPEGWQPPATREPGPALDMNRPGNCYASMLAPLIDFPVKGAIWHQGFNNALQPNGHVFYRQVFPEMIASWRAHFRDEHMPFGIISLCTAGEPQDADNYLEQMLDEGVLIRAVQYQTFLDLRKSGDKNIGFASSFDQRRSWFHPQIKIPVGERIARWALSTQYGMNRIRWIPPAITGIKVESGRVLLTLDSDTGPYHDGPITGFAIAGEDGKFQPATADFLVTGSDGQGRPQRDRKTIVLTSPLVSAPVHFRHAWSRNPMANLKTSDHTDIPLATQRSDSWSLADMYQSYTGKAPSTPGQLQGNERAELTRALRAADLERRKAAAKSLLSAEP